MKTLVLAWASLLTVLPLTVGAQVAFTPPPNDGFVTQQTALLTAEQEQQLETTLQTYATETSNEIAILIVETLNQVPAADAALQTLRAWKVGRSDVNNGVVILVSAADRQMAISVGYGLEGAVPDLVAKGIIDTDLAPAFRDSDYAGGLTAAIDALQKHIGGEYTADRYTAAGFSLGEGAVSFIFFVVYVLGSYFASTKSWWQGGVVGGIFGIVLMLVMGWWLAIPVFIILGLGTDYVLSQTGWQHAPQGRFRRGLGYRGGYRSGGSGFRGFSGGSGGGGGASGSW